MAIEPSPRRGEVWLVAFGPSIGGEIQKTLQRTMGKLSAEDVAAVAGAIRLQLGL